jgi:hypothetical protein
MFQVPFAVHFYVRAYGEQHVCIFTWYSYSWGAICMHFHMVFLELEPFVSIFIWYSYSWGAICMHFDMVLV